MIRQFITVLFIFIFTSIRLQGQLHFEQIEGLSQSTGYSIMKDKQGFLWIATANGLNRYDGMEMKVYKPSFEKKSGQMEGRIIRSELLEDDKEQIWFSTDLAVHCFKKRNEEFVSYNLLNKAKGVFANPLLIKDSHLWLASADAGVFDLNTSTKKTQHYPLKLKDEAGNYIQLMYNGVHDDKNRIWFASSKGLITFNLVTKQWQRHFSDKAFYSVSFCQDTLYASEKNEIIWVAIDNLHFGRSTFSERDHEVSRDLIHRVYTDKNLNTWVGDEKGNVYCKTTQSSAFNWMGNINAGGTISTNYPVYCFYTDTSGILWAGAYMLGLLKAELTRQEFNVYPKPEINKVIDNLFVNAIYENGENELWLGTFQKGIVILNKQTGNITSLKLPYTGPQLLYGNSVHLIHSDSKGNLWTGVSGYLFVREKNASSFLSIKIPYPSNSLQNPQAWNITEYKKGWLLGTNIGLYYLVKEKDKYSIILISLLGQARISALWKSADNEVWIAFESGGITIVKDPETSHESRKLFSETNVKAFLHDKHHQLLWISTTSGLIAWHLPSGKFKSFAEKEGLNNSYTYGALQDSNKLWVSTNYGLFRTEFFFKKDSILPDAVFTNFTSKDGLPGNQFNSLAFYKGKEGDLYFGTTKGLVWFNPATIKPDLQPVKLQMINVLVNEKPPNSAIAPEYITALSLPFYENNLFFRFRGIDYTKPSKVNYAYKLEGWDKDWIYSNQLNEVRYSNLQYGDYLFKVKAANSSGAWGKEVYTVSIKINPPFWNTWWFYGLMSLLFLSIVVGTTKYLAQRKLRKRLAELEKQRELDRERQRISREMHDDIGAGLTQITLMSESARNKSSVSSEKELVDIADTSRKLVNNMSEIIWSLNPENKTLDQLFSYLREQLNKLLEYSGMDYSVQFPEKSTDIVLSNEQRRNLLLVVKEIVHNAVKYSKAKQLSVTASLQEQYLGFEITDDGVGFNTGKNYSGNGLRNIQTRIAELNGVLSVTSSPGKGTTYTFTIPYT